MIVAPATPAGVAALAVVRLSGPAGETLRVARRLAPTLPLAPEPARARRCRLVDGQGEALDDALVLPFRAPRSATGEEVVELFCHGSPAIVAALVAAAQAAGARLAAPGEFTRRALLNGKLDLAAAEGIERLAAAESRGAARRALGLVDGDLSRQVRAAREVLLDALAEVEAGLDFPEDVDLAVPVSRVESLAAELAGLARRAHGLEAGARVPTVAIVGPPNAGKSTLFNALVGSDRAIVTAIPGTTRDAVSEEIEIGGERVRLVDTAGLRETEDEVERQGVAVARRVAAGADLALVVEDGGAGPPEATGFLVRTKADLRGLSTGLKDGVAVVSAPAGAGIGEVRAEIARRLRLEERGEGPLVLERHRTALSRAAEALESGLAELVTGGPELLAGGLRRALSALGEVTGETATEELLDRIFARFCLGK